MKYKKGKDLRSARTLNCQSTYAFQLKAHDFLMSFFQNLMIMFANSIEISQTYIYQLYIIHEFSFRDIIRSLISGQRPFTSCSQVLSLNLVRRTHFIANNYYNNFQFHQLGKNYRFFRVERCLEVILNQGLVVR